MVSAQRTCAPLESGTGILKHRSQIPCCEAVPFACDITGACLRLFHLRRVECCTIRPCANAQEAALNGLRSGSADEVFATPSMTPLSASQPGSPLRPAAAGATIETCMRRRNQPCNDHLITHDLVLAETYQHDRRACTCVLRCSTCERAVSQQRSEQCGVDGGFPPTDAVSAQPVAVSEGRRTRCAGLRQHRCRGNSARQCR